MDARPNNARNRAGFMVATGAAVLVGSLGFAWLGGRDYQSPSGGPQTRVEGNTAITFHETPPIFGGTDLTARYDLPVRNWWNERIHITKIIPSCSCGTAELASRELSPNGETKLHVEVKFPPVGGERDISCVLEAKDGKRLSHRFQVVAYPYVQLDSENGAVSFGEVMPGKEVQASQMLFLHARKDAGALPEIVSVKAGSPNVTAWIDPISKDKVEELPGGYGLRGATTLRVRLRPERYAGVGATDLAVQYRGHGFSGTAHVPVMWNVKQLFEFGPSRLFVTVDREQTDPLEKSVWLQSTENRPFRVRSINSSVPWIRGIKAGSDALPVQAVSFEIHPGHAESKGFTELEIVTDHPSQPKIHLPVSLFRTSAMGDANAD